MKGKPLPGSEDGSLFDSLDLNSVVLLPGERLKLHMDCMPAYGPIITIDDVDDMGGSVRSIADCWFINVNLRSISHRMNLYQCLLP